MTTKKARLLGWICVRQNEDSGMSWFASYNCIKNKMKKWKREHTLYMWLIYLFDKYCKTERSLIYIKWAHMLLTGPIITTILHLNKTLLTSYTKYIGSTECGTYFKKV